MRILIFALFCAFGMAKATAVSEGGKVEKVEYFQLPLLAFAGGGGVKTGVVSKVSLGNGSSLPSVATPSTTERQKPETRVNLVPVTTTTLMNTTTAIKIARNVTVDKEEITEEDDEEVEEPEEDEEEEEASDDDDLLDGDDDGDQDEDDVRGTLRHDLSNVTATQNEVDGEIPEEEEEDFNEVDLIELVEDLEQQADQEEENTAFSEVLDIIHAKFHRERFTSTSSTEFPPSTLSPLLKIRPLSNQTLPEIDEETESFERNASLRYILNDDGDLELGSEDLSEFSEEIVNGVSEGIEESLRMSNDLDFDFDHEEVLASIKNASEETRQFSHYLFQGQYFPEYRLNRFIDGAFRNMGNELRLASMDPLFFRVLPRGRVVERKGPKRKFAAVGIGAGVNRRRPATGLALAVASHGFGRQLGGFFSVQVNKNPNQRQNLRRQQDPKKTPPFRQGQRGRGKKKKPVPGRVTKVTGVRGTNFFQNLQNKKRLQQQQNKKRLEQQRKRRQRLKQQRLKNQRMKNRRKKQQQNKNKKKNNFNRNKNKKNKFNFQNRNKFKGGKNRFRKSVKKNVGGGRIEGLSRVERDGDAEMQLFGNYTLIRSHMKIGPVRITMQFRTKKGIRRSGATLPVLRAHTVCRVNQEGSEMIDYLLDRPHPESIRVRGGSAMLPQTEKMARNIFAKLFLPNSFLVARLKEKANVAFLSRPVGIKNVEQTIYFRQQQ